MSDAMKILIAISSATLIVAGALYVVFSICYHIDSKGAQKLTYRQFEALFRVAPYKWCVNWSIDPVVVYEGKHVIWMASYFDALRLKLFLRRYNKRLANMAYCDRRSQLIGMFKKDIENYVKSSNDNLGKLKEDIWAL